MNQRPEKSVFRTTKLPKIGRDEWNRVLRPLFKKQSIEQTFQDSQAWDEERLIDKILQELEVSFQYFEDELKRIPTEGPGILICNHPLAGIDALLLIKLLSSVRSDLQIIGSDLWQDLKPIAHFWNLEGSAGNSISEGLEAGKLVAVFPAKGISRNYRISKLQLEDGPWDDELVEQIAQAGVSVTPIYFKANQTLIYHLLQRLGPTFQDLKIPSEIRSYKSRPVTIRIGRSIYPKEISRFAEVRQLREFFRQRIFLLSQALAPEYKLFGRKRPSQALAIADPISKEKQQKELRSLRNSGALISEKRNYQVFLGKAVEIPHILQEIGRQREIAFRSIGEGTNLALDLDPFDYHYNHLVLWDKDEDRLVGAYRLAIGSEVYQSLGYPGFYVSTLFRFKKKIRPMLGQSLELGRAFIIGDHQQKPLPLFVMWNGIREVMRRNPQLEYIIGCASISNNFSRFSRNLMVGFLLKNFGDSSLAQDIRPRKPYRLKLKSEAREMVMQSKPEDLVQFDRKVDELEPGDLRIPPLIKKYLQQKALIVCFNVDPLFNDSLDGFMYIRRENLEL